MRPLCRHRAPASKQAGERASAPPTAWPLTCFSPHDRRRNPPRPPNHQTTPRGARREETFDNILRNPLAFPPKPAISEAAQDLISKLLTKDAAQRVRAPACMRQHARAYGSALAPPVALGRARF